MIQPPPQECGARRAFPAITQRGRGWRANGFNYHSDRNAGRQGPGTHHRTGQDWPTSSQRVLDTPPYTPAGMLAHRLAIQGQWARSHAVALGRTNLAPTVAVI